MVSWSICPFSFTEEISLDRGQKFEAIVCLFKQHRQQVVGMADLVSYQFCPKWKYQGCNNIFLQVMHFPIWVLLVFFFFYFCSSRYAKTKIKSVLDYLFPCAQQGLWFLRNIWASLVVSYKVINVAWYLLWQLLCTLFNHLHHGLSFLIFLFLFCLFSLDSMMPDKYPFFDIPLIFFLLFYRFNFTSLFRYSFSTYPKPTMYKLLI